MAGLRNEHQLHSRFLCECSFIQSSVHYNIPGLYTVYYICIIIISYSIDKLKKERL